MNDKLEGIWIEAALNLHKGTEKVTQPGFEPRNLNMRVKSVTLTPNSSVEVCSYLVLRINYLYESFMKMFSNKYIRRTLDK
jgi:hypothetical protein